MSNPGAFVLPAGVRLTMEGGALSIENTGDIVIEGTPAQDLHTLRSTGGDVLLSPPSAASLDSVAAPKGTVTINGNVSLESIVAKVVRFEGGSLKVGVIKASESIVLAGSKLEAHVVMAPKVEVNANIKGRATAIESDNELGPHKLKGGFSLAEFIDFMPEGAAMLKKHDIAVPESEDDGDDDEELSAAAAGAADEAAADSGAAVSKGASSAMVAIDDALKNILNAYEGDDVPPPIEELTELVVGGDVGKLKERINGVWSELLKHAQQTEPFYIANTLTHMFQKIQMELRKA